MRHCSSSLTVISTGKARRNPEVSIMPGSLALLEMTLLEQRINGKRGGE